MPVPSVLTDLSVNAASNSPLGTELVGTNLDNYIRAHAAIIKQFTEDLANGTDAAKGAGIPKFAHNLAYAPGTVGLALDAVINVKNAPFNAKCDGVTDDRAAIQAAIDFCSTKQRWPAILIPGRCFLSGSLNIDRLVDTTISEFRIVGQGEGAGFYCSSAINLFDSTLTVTADPKSEHIAFEGIHFEVSSNLTNAYVVSKKFLRVRFQNCFFEKIKAISADIYTQDFRFNDCKARAWTGVFFGSQGSYSIKVSSSVFEFGGSGFYTPHDTGAVGVYGCSMIGSLYENCSGPAWTTNFTGGLAIHGNYFEGNTGQTLKVLTGFPNRGISIKGNLFVTLSAELANASFYEADLGNATYVSSGGNWSNGRLYDTTNLGSPGLFTAGDYAELELGKNTKTSLLSSARTAAVGRLQGVDPAGYLYATNGQTWAAVDPVFGGIAVGPGVVQSGAFVPIRIIVNSQNPGVNNAFYGNPFWTAGSRVINSAPAVGQPKAWACTVSGQPGTWVSEGNL